MQEKIFGIDMSINLRKTSEAGIFGIHLLSCALFLCCKTNSTNRA